MALFALGLTATTRPSCQTFGIVSDVRAGESYTLKTLMPDSASPDFR